MTIVVDAPQNLNRQIRLCIWSSPFETAFTVARGGHREEGGKAAPPGSDTASLGHLSPVREKRRQCEGRGVLPVSGPTRDIRAGRQTDLGPPAQSGRETEERTAGGIRHPETTLRER